MYMKFDCNDNHLTQKWSGTPVYLATGVAAIIASIYFDFPEGARETFREALSVFVDGDDALMLTLVLLTLVGWCVFFVK